MNAKSILTTTYLLSIALLTHNHSVGYIKLPNDTAAVFEIVQKYLRQDPVIVEGGAYDGTDTEKMALLWPNGIIHSFEPVPQNYEKLVAKTKEFVNVRRYKKALTNYTGTAKFFVSEEVLQPNVPSGSGSLFEPKKHLDYDKNIIFPYKIKVNTVTGSRWAADNSINKIDFLWLDVQGSEINALKGFSSLLNTVSVIYLELSFIEAYADQATYVEIRDWLNENGFKMVAADFIENQEILNKDIKTDNPFYYGNGVFVRKDLLTPEKSEL